MDNQLFERCFIATVCEYGHQQYGSIMAYAKKIWPEKDDKNAAQTLYAIQKRSSKTGKPQALPLHLAVLMVDLLDKSPSFPSFCFEIAEKIRLGWTDAEAERAMQQQNEATPSKKEFADNQEACTHRPPLSGVSQQPETYAG